MLAVIFPDFRDRALFQKQINRAWLLLVWWLSDIGGWPRINDEFADMDECGFDIYVGERLVVNIGYGEGYGSSAGYWVEFIGGDLCQHIESCRPSRNIFSIARKLRRVVEAAAGRI